MDAHAYCRDKAAASGSSFYYSFRFLSPERRRAITAFYAFCREVDDIADECRDPEVARAKLAWWRDEVARLFAGEGAHPVSLALSEAIAPYRLPREAFEQIIDGMEMDLGRVRYDDFKALNLYCHRVAGVVGEDARRDRIYLPLDELARFGVNEAEIRQGRMSDAFRRLMEFQYQRACGVYDEALALLPAADRKAQRPGLIMAAIYRALLDEIRADGFQVLDRRTSLTPLRKFWLAWRTWSRG